MAQEVFEQMKNGLLYPYSLPNERCKRFVCVVAYGTMYESGNKIRPRDRGYVVVLLGPRMGIHYVSFVPERELNRILRRASSTALESGIPIEIAVARELFSSGSVTLGVLRNCFKPDEVYNREIWVRLLRK